MSRIINPKLKVGDRIVCVDMEDEPNEFQEYLDRIMFEQNNRVTLDRTGYARIRDAKTGRMHDLNNAGFRHLMERLG